MDAGVWLNIAGVVIGCASTGTLIGLVTSRYQTARMLTSLGGNTRLHRGERETASPTTRRGVDVSRMSEAIRQGVNAQSRRDTLKDELFRAGFFSEEAQARYITWRRVGGLAGCALGLACGVVAGGWLMIVSGVLGLAVGIHAPRSYIQRVSERRAEEIMFYLPLVIEQLVIGVSSSLDVGPCLKWIVAMADERDSHNPVTELLRYAQLYMKSGVSMEEALIEVGRLSGHTELKHVFMSLSQVAKHGGEIIRQLQELANAVAAQREARVEGKIRKLELKATGPVALVFASFMGILMVGLGTQLGGLFR